MEREYYNRQRLEAELYKKVGESNGIEVWENGYWRVYINAKENTEIA